LRYRPRCYTCAIEGNKKAWPFLARAPQFRELNRSYQATTGTEDVQFAARQPQDFVTWTSGWD
jgi:hypothetical protein